MHNIIQDAKFLLGGHSVYQNPCEGARSSMTQVLTKQMDVEFKWIVHC